MSKIFSRVCLSACCALLCTMVLVSSGPAQAAAPAVNLKVWSESSQQERYAFLAGFVNLLELEKEWQGQKGLLPLKQSLIGSWVHGLDGVTLKAMLEKVDAYAAANPAKSNKLVLEVLWDEFVQSKIQGTPTTEGKAARKTLRSQRTK